jgi:hypothetical protein
MNPSHLIPDEMIVSRKQLHENDGILLRQSRQEPKEQRFNGEFVDKSTVIPNVNAVDNLEVASVSSSSFASSSHDTVRCLAVVKNRENKLIQQTVNARNRRKV